jgi:hypothetical protein
MVVISAAVSWMFAQFTQQTDKAIKQARFMVSLLDTET